MATVLLKKLTLGTDSAGHTRELDLSLTEDEVSSALRLRLTTFVLGHNPGAAFSQVHDIDKLADTPVSEAAYQDVLRTADALNAGAGADLPGNAAAAFRAALERLPTSGQRDILRRALTRVAPPNIAKAGHRGAFAF